MLSRNLLQALEDIARTAGDAIMAIYQSADFSAARVSQKDNNTPLTTADLKAHEIITELLQQLPAPYGSLPQLSEESDSISWQQRQEWQQYWLIDPLDGTKEFLKQNGEFTVNIALIDAGVPVAGVVYAPAQNNMWSAALQLGVWKNGVQLSMPSAPATPEPIRVLCSRSHPSPELNAYLAANHKAHELIAVGSSLKFALLADGSADLYPRFGPTSEWDTAAGHALLLALGGDIKRFDGNSLRYNQKQSLLNPNFIAKISSP